MNPSSGPDRVPAVTVNARDLAALILAAHGAVAEIPRGLRRRHDTVVDIVAATVGDVHPGIAQRRYRLDEPPAAAFAVKQRGLTIEVVVEHADGLARAKFYTRTKDAESPWPAKLAETTHRALLSRNIIAILS